MRAQSLEALRQFELLLACELPAPGFAQVFAKIAAKVRVTLRCEERGRSTG
jgi:hypothetical protein